MNKWRKKGQVKGETEGTPFFSGHIPSDLSISHHDLPLSAHKSCPLASMCVL